MAPERHATSTVAAAHPHGQRAAVGAVALGRLPEGERHVAPAGAQPAQGRLDLRLLQVRLVVDVADDDGLGAAVLPERGEAERADEPLPALTSHVEAVREQPDAVRVAASFALSYFFAFAAQLTLLLLPGQKEEAQRRKRMWPRRTRYAVISVVLVAVALAYSLTINFLSVSEATQCLRIVGGHGCEEEGEET